MRSQFILSAAAGAVLLTGCVMPPKRMAPAEPAPAPETKEFWWGTSTAPFQNEDRGFLRGTDYYYRTDWDLFAEEGRAAERGDDAVFSWTHFDEDVRALRKMGVNHFRFGVEWARVEPKPGVFNEKAIRQYARMARTLKANGIEPVVTLWHFTFPDWLYDPKRKSESNFLHPEVEERWKIFVTKMADALSPYVRTYVPQNEPNGALQLGYIGGHWPPGYLMRPFLYKRAMKVSARMFRDAAEIVRSKRSDAIIMGIYSLPHWRRNYMWDPTGMTYNTMLRQNYDHLDMVADSMDFIGVNYYYTQYATIPDFLNHGQGEVAWDFTQIGWEIEPEGLYESLTRTWDRYKKPLVITENGLGTLSEAKKISYFRSHINQVRRAMHNGIDIRGYFPWTLVDNYEWTEGYVANFGLTAMDPDTKERILEPSALWFRNFIRANPEP